MQDHEWKKIEEIFNRAAELPPAERRQFAEDACGEDVALLGELLAILEADQDEREILDERVFTLGLRLLESDDIPLEKGRFATYDVERLIGRGGMGSVYLATDVRLRRPVALKILPSTLGEEAQAVRRFRQEALSASAISHPNVAHIYEFAEFEGRFFLAMEFVEGRTLRQILSERLPDVRSAIDIAAQIAGALTAMHEKGIIHRDIKPENIVVSDRGLAKVLDFGVSKVIGWHSAEDVSVSDSTPLVETVPGVVMGTIGYMSPEQIRNEATDFQADIWSLGIVLFEMLTGRNPFGGGTASDVRSAILEGRREAIPKLFDVAENQERIEELIGKALHRDGRPQFGSASEFLDAARELLFRIEHGNGSNARISQTTEQFVPDTGSYISQTDEGVAPAAQVVTGRHRSKLRPLFLGLIPILAGIVAVSIWYAAGRPSATTNPEFPKVANLTKDGRVQDVAISPDGRWLVHSPIESGRQRIWLRDLNNGDERELYQAESVKFWGFRFFPDGRRLLYISTATTGAVNWLSTLDTADGTARRIVTNIAEPPAISPDGQKIAFVRTNPVEKHDDLFIAAADGSGERILAVRRYPDNFSPGSASWSSDGKYIALGAGRNNGAEHALVKVSVEDGAFAELTDWKWAGFGGAACESDGAGVVFSAREGKSRALRIWRFSFADTAAIPLTDPESSYEEVTLAGSGERLVTMRTYEVANIWRVDKNGEPTRLTTQSSNGADGIAVAGAERVIYTVGEYEQSRLWSMNLDGGDRKLLTPDQTSAFLPAASPDGKMIAYVSIENGRRHLWLMDGDGGNRRQVTEGEGENTPSFSPDGKWIYYVSLGKQHNTIWKMPSEGGEPQQVTTAGYTVKPQISPDGRFMACAFRRDANDEWKIKVVSVGDPGKEMTFDIPNPRLQMIRWSPDSRGLYFTDSNAAAQNLWLQPLDGGQPTRVTNFQEDQILHHNSPVQGLFIFSRGGRKRDIAMIENYRKS